MKPEDARPTSGRGEATKQAASRARDSGPQQQCTKRRAPAEAPSPGAGGTGTRRQVSRISRRGVRAPVTSLSARPSPLAPQRRPRRRRGPPFPLPLPSGNRVGAGDEHKGCGGPAGGRPPPRSGRRGRAVSWLTRKRRRRCLSCPVVPAPSSGQTNARRSADAGGSPSRRRSGLLLWTRTRWAAQPAVACPPNPPHRRTARLSDRHQRAVRVLERSPAGGPGRVQRWREAG